LIKLTQQELITMKRAVIDRDAGAALAMVELVVMRAERGAAGGMKNHLDA
jgi:hypothetical protein